MLKVVQWFLMGVGFITVVMFLIGLIVTAFQSKPIEEIVEDEYWGSGDSI